MLGRKRWRVNELRVFFRFTHSYTEGKKAELSRLELGDAASL
jgi:hypothetical protein